MNRGLYFLRLVVLCVLGGASQAICEERGGSPDLEIYVVDMQSVIDGSVAGKAAKNSLERDVVKGKARVEKAKRDFEVAERELLKQKSLLAEEAFLQRSEGLRKKKLELSRLVSDEQERLQASSDKAVKKMVDEVEKLLPKLAQEKNAPLILQKDPRVVLYVNPKYDLSPDLVKMVDNLSLSF